MCFCGGSFCFALVFVYTHMHTFLGTLIYTHTRKVETTDIGRTLCALMTMKWNLVGCFFIVFFLCFVFLCSLFFLALLNAVRCCYLLVILVLLLLITTHIRIVVRISHQSCLLWPLLLRPSLVSLPQLLHRDLAHLTGAGRQC